MIKSDVCEFETKHRNGMKIHKSRIHKFKSVQCNQAFPQEDSLKRHEEAKATLYNLDPCTNLDKSMKIDIFRIYEVCHAVFDQELNRVQLILHSWSCSSREHSCTDLPPADEFTLSRKFEPRHVDIGTVVMGSLDLAGCFVD